jgi:hypothetical protein
MYDFWFSGNSQIINKVLEIVYATNLQAVPPPKAEEFLPLSLVADYLEIPSIFLFLGISSSNTN